MSVKIVKIVYFGGWGSIHKRQNIWWPYELEKYSDFCK